MKDYNRIVMGYWDCPYCNSKGIKGTLYDCPSCGRQRGKETEFYMGENIEYVEGHTVYGPDWYCEYCGALNSGKLTECENCSSPRKKAKDDYFSLKNNKPKSVPKSSYPHTEFHYKVDSRNQSDGIALSMQMVHNNNDSFKNILIIHYFLNAMNPKG